ncbi:hypothetical protein A0H81_00396 [Grifola frondosa]|uniref:Uncharacterized protein n=1 Tax=Grifola frondosa TaxID=5627 RepID=A0A1C7MT75_GRIFR|nr:hypothetical protein A0H81_00396 [Grifola frondosa]
MLHDANCFEGPQYALCKCETSHGYLTEGRLLLPGLAVQENEHTVTRYPSAAMFSSLPNHNTMARCQPSDPSSLRLNSDNILADSSGIYITEYLFIVLSRCAFIATEYAIPGYVARYLKRRHVSSAGEHCTRTAVRSSEQAVGGNLSTTHNPSLLKIGEHILLMDLALQLASFAVFFCLALTFFYHVRSFEPQIRHQDGAKPFLHNWRALAAPSCSTPLASGGAIWCVYRTIELSQGYQGRLVTTEAFFCGLDALPLFVALAVYVPSGPREDAEMQMADAEQPEHAHERRAGYQGDFVALSRC